MSDFFEIIFHPGRVFSRLRKKGNWVAAYLAVVVLATLPTVMVISTAGIELLTLQRYQHNPVLAEKVGGDAGIEREVSSSNERWTKLLVVSRVAAFSAVSVALLAALFMGAAAIFDVRPNYFVMLGTVSFAAFPFELLGLAISVILLYSGFDQSSLDLENMPGLNLGRLLDRARTNPAIFAMATEMDLLLGGQILLMSFGLTRISKISFTQGLAICGGIWAIVVLVKAALSAYI